MSLLGPARTRALLDKHGLRPRTAIGQHFVTDPNTVRKMVSLAEPAPGSTVIEVGPGLGALTIALLEAGHDVLAIERDERLRPVLEEVAPGARVVWQDALELDVARVVPGPASVVANLPYQIATPLLIGWLERFPRIGSYTVMVQREVGERLAATPGTGPYGAVSAKVAYLAEASIVARVSRRVFYPQPEVESVIVRLRRRERPPVAGGRARIFAVIRAGFAQRRKTIRRALRGGGWSAAEVEAALEAARVSGSARAETLSLDDFARLARALPPRPSGGAAR
ncbi:MAG TPA: 16S rRNA (adenine(1518)-N(6)/adenine(1519)-N(6))-dimethyltransferase RsmA [Actinomycetota bacterium]